MISPLGEEHRGSWAPSLESFLNRDISPLGVNFGKQILVSFVLIYLISLLFACETSFLGFELDLLTHEFLVSSVCWISILRNPWYSYFSSIYFSYIDSCSFFSVCTYPETLVIAPEGPQNPEYTGWVCIWQGFKCFWVADCLFTPPLGILRSFQNFSQRTHLIHPIRH